MTDINVQEFGEYKNRVKSLEARMEKAENVQRIIYDLNSNVAVLVNELKRTNDNLNEHETRLGKLEGRDSETVSKWRAALISALAGSVVTLVVGAVVGMIIQKGGV